MLPVLLLKGRKYDDASVLGFDCMCVDVSPFSGCREN